MLKTLDFSRVFDFGSLLGEHHGGATRIWTGGSEFCRLVPYRLAISPLCYLTVFYPSLTQFLERETGLKPATFALARRRSINWATPACAFLEAIDDSLACNSVNALEFWRSKNVCHSICLFRLTDPVVYTERIRCRVLNFNFITWLYS